MVNKFNQLQTSISNEEATNGKTAKIVDFKFNTVSAQQSDLTIGVIYAGSLHIDGCEDWPASESTLTAGEILTECILAALGDNNSWFQTVEIVNPSSCYPNGPNFMYQAEGITMEPEEFDEAFTAAEEMIDCFYSTIWPPLGGGAEWYGTPVLVDIHLFGDYALCCTEYSNIQCSADFTFTGPAPRVARGVPYHL